VPTYQYACTGCGHELEAVQSFSDDPLTTCPECGESLRKLFGNVGVVFKGSGFYRTDSRTSGSTTSTSGGSSDKSGATSDSATTKTGAASTASSTSTSSTSSKAATTSD